MATAGALSLNVDSDDFAAVIINGNLVLARGNGGTGFSGNGNGGGGTTTVVDLPVGTSSIEVVYDQGGGSWGIVPEYTFTPSTGSPGNTFFVGQNNTGNVLSSGQGRQSGANDPSADAVTFTSNVFTAVNVTNGITLSTGTSNTLTINADLASTVGSIAMNAGSSLTINGTGGAPSLQLGQVTASGAVTLNNVISATTSMPGLVNGGTAMTSFTLTGNGMLNVTSASTTTGAVNINGGYLIAQVDGALGTGQVTVNPGGQLLLAPTGGSYSKGPALIINGFGPAGDGALTINSSVTLNNAVDLGSNASIVSAVGGQTFGMNGGVNNNGNTITFGGNGNFAINTVGISGGGSLLQTGGGTLNLNAAGSFSGGTTVNSGVLNVGNNLATGTGRVTLAGGAVNFLSANPSIGSLAGTAGPVTLGNSAGPVNATLTVGNDGSSTTFLGTI